MLGEQLGVSAGKRIPARATQPLRVSSLTPGAILIVVRKIVKKEAEKQRLTFA
jgi:hypothetical protein